ERPANDAHRPFELAPPETAQLSNGIKLVVFPRPTLPLVHATILFQPPRYVFNDAAGNSAGRAGLTMAMLREGAGERDALQFDEALQTLGARLSTGAGHESASVSLS